MKDRTVNRLSSLTFVIACLTLVSGLLLPLGHTATATPPPPPQISGGDPDAPGSSSAPHTGEQAGGSTMTRAVGLPQSDVSTNATGVVTPFGKTAVVIRPQPTSKFTSWAGIKGLYVR